MRTPHTRDNLIERIRQKCKEEIAQAETARDAAIAEIRGLSPLTMNAIASAYADDQPEYEEEPHDNETPDEPQDAEMGQNETELRIIESGYGKITQSVREIVSGIDGVFTVRDIMDRSNGATPKSATIAGVLKRLEKDGLVVCRKPGSGKRPGQFERKANATQS